MRQFTLQSHRPAIVDPGAAWPEGDGAWTHLVAGDGPLPRASVDHLDLGSMVGALGQPEAHALLRACRIALRGQGTVSLSLPSLRSVIDRYLRGEARDPVAEGRGDIWIPTAAERLQRDLARSGWVYDEEEARLLAQRVGLDVDEFAARDDGSLHLRLRRPWPQLAAEPLVSVLMTAYKPTYFREALASVLAQTWTNIEVLIFDDSPDSRIGDIVASVSDPRIRYHKNAERIKSQRNYAQAFAAAQGELVKYVCDDDRLLPGCLARMIACFREFPDVTLVTSARDILDESGKVQPPIGATRRPFSVDSRMDGRLVTHMLLENRVNFVGEPTTVMFRRADLEWVRPHLISYKGMPAIGNGDVTKWLNLLGRGDAIYLTEPLSQFRLHAQQAQRTEPNSMERGLRAWDLNRQQAVDLGQYLPGSIPPLRPERLERRPWWSPAQRGDVGLSGISDIAQAEAWTERQLAAGVDPQLPKSLLELMRRFPLSVGVRFGLIRALSRLGVADTAHKLLAQTRDICPPIAALSGFTATEGDIVVSPIAAISIVALAPPLNLILQVSTQSLHGPVVISLEIDGVPAQTVEVPPGEAAAQITYPLDSSGEARVLALRWSRAGGRAPDEFLSLKGFAAMLRLPPRG